MPSNGKHDKYETSADSILKGQTNSSVENYSMILSKRWTNITYYPKYCQPTLWIPSIGRELYLDEALSSYLIHECQSKFLSFSKCHISCCLPLTKHYRHAPVLLSCCCGLEISITLQHLGKTRCGGNRINLRIKKGHKRTLSPIQLLISSTRCYHW